MDYKVYQITKKEMFRYAAVYILADVLISLLFYRSVLAAVVFLPGICFFFREVRRELAKKRRKQLERGFLVGMRCVSTALTAGYSVENAFTQAYEELQKLYSEKEPVLQEFRRIRVGILLNRTMEELLSDLAQRSGVEDIEIFSEVFETARRTGGDLIAIIRSTTASVSQKEETRQEIEICLSAKKMEQNIMSLIPGLLIAYVGLASPGFLDVMYQNLAGLDHSSGLMGKYLGGILWMSSTKMNNECFHLILGYTTFWKNNVGNKLNSIFEIGPMSTTTQTFKWTGIFNLK